MNTNFYELYYRCCEDIRNTQSDAQTLMKRWVNESVTDFMSRWQWRFAIKEGFALANTNEHLISLPEEMRQVLLIRQKESNVKMRIMPASEFDMLVPDPTSTGTPEIVVEHGLSAVIKQPQGIISAYSTDATASGVVSITGDVDGLETVGTITLNGITPVACTTYFNRIYKGSVSVAPAGVNTITITDGTPTTLATIAAGATSAVITAQPAQRIEFVSSSALDTSSVGLVRVSGFDGDGMFRNESVPFNGVTSDRTDTYYNTIERISKSAVTTGVFTFSTASPIRTIAKIAPTSFGSQYIRIGLYPIPSTTINLFIRYKAIPRKMVLDSDTFWPIPDEYGFIIKEAALARGWDYMKLPNRGDMCRRNYEQYIEIAKRDDARRVSTELVIGGSGVSSDSAFSRSRTVSEATN